MPAARTYNLLISHAWRYGEDYYRLVELLDAVPGFQWRNYSIPEDDPILSAPGQGIASQLQEQVRRCHAVLMLGGTAGHRGWMRREVDMASSYAKPIVALQPWGGERMSSVVREAAEEVVGWDAGSIVSAIRRHAL